MLNKYMLNKWKNFNIVYNNEKNLETILMLAK